MDAKFRAGQKETICLSREIGVPGIQDIDPLRGGSGVYIYRKYIRNTIYIYIYTYIYIYIYIYKNQFKNPILSLSDNLK